MAAAGKVLTGFSKPYVALYSVSTAGVVSYSDGQILARGVDMTISPETSDDNKFYADNQMAENAGGLFTGGTLSLTVDGLLEPAEKLVFGLGSASGNWYAFDDDMDPPYMGFAAIARYMSDGVTSYTPVALTKVRFKPLELSAATQEDEIDWQTQAMEASIFRDDSAKHVWKKLGEAQTTEASAEALIKTLFGITP